ncbi:MAG: YceI family protein [Melioribacter sp.]|uniref:YceI family protein n=1 Tax=Rosettibacter primus TaxID=3111523 RepID=UPI00247E1218|nr:YceI family protein [Melioribacter sp.]
MKKYFLLSFIFFINFIINAQGFKVKASGTQTFYFEDESGRNQATFFSTTPLEDITGTANGISGSVTFDVANFANTLRGKVIVKVASINTGIELRNKHLRSKNWLDAEKYPDIIFDIKSVTDVKQLADNKLSFKVIGNFSMHGVTKEISANVEATYLDENEDTRKRAPGDLLGIRGKFNIKLSDFKVENQIIGNKVAEEIEVSVNIVGSNKK